MAVVWQAGLPYIPTPSGLIPIVWAGGMPIPLLVTGVPIPPTGPGLEFASLEFSSPSIHPLLLSMFDVFTALETPQIVITWGFALAVAAQYPPTELQIRRSSVRFPLSKTEGTEVVTVADPADPAAITSFADTGVDPLEFYYYTAFVTYDSGTYTALLYERDIARMLSVPRGIHNDPWHATDSRIWLVGRDVNNTPLLWVYNLDTGFADDYYNLSEILEEDEKVLSIIYAGPLTIGATVYDAFGVVTDSRVLFWEKTDHHPLGTDLIWDYDIQTAVNAYIGSPTSFTVAGACMDWTGGTQARILDSTLKRHYLINLPSGVIVSHTSLAALSNTGSLRGIAIDPMGVGAAAECVLVGDGDVIYTFDRAVANPADIDILQTTETRHSLTSDFSWVYDVALTKKVILVIDYNYDRHEAYEQGVAASINYQISDLDTGYAYSGREYVTDAFSFRDRLFSFVSRYVRERPSGEIDLPPTTVLPDSEIVFRGGDLHLDETERICRLFGLILDRCCDTRDLQVRNQNSATCDPIFLDSHCRLLGIKDLDATLPINHQRFYLEAMREICRRKGTLWSFRAILRFYGYDIDLSTFAVDLGRLHFDTTRVWIGESIGAAGLAHYTGTLAHKPVIPYSVQIEDPAGYQVIADDGAGNLVGAVNPAGVNTISYDSGAYDVTFAAVTTGDPVAAYNSGTQYLLDTGYLDTFHPYSPVKIYLGIYRILDNEPAPYDDPITQALLSKLDDKVRPYNAIIYYLT